MKKTVFFCSSDGWGGLEMNTIKLIRLLTEDQLDIELFCRENTRLQEQAIRQGIKHTVIHRPKKHFDVRTAIKLAKTLKERNAEILFVVDNYDLSVCVWAKRFYSGKLKLVYQQHMQIGINKKDFIHTIRYRKIDAWITPLKYLKDEILLRTRFSEDKIHQIPIGVDTDKFLYSQLNKSDARRFLRIPEAGLFIGCIGRIDPKKGQDFVLKNFITVANLYPDIRLLIVGEPTVNNPDCKLFMKNLKRTADNSGCSERIFFLPFSKDVLPVYSALDIFILPSVGETYGMVTIEAMLSGLPVIGTQSGGTPEILDHGASGKLFAPGDDEAFRNLLLELINNPSEIHRIGNKAKSSAAKRFSQETERNEIARLIQSF